MKVSIIVPIYNVAPYVEECLNSVIAQSYKGEMECILVDDCGTDDSIAICERIIKEYEGNIDFSILHREKNGGLSAARNSGLDVAKGEYIYFLDSDDWIVSNAIETMVDGMCDGTSIVAFGFEYFGKDNSVQETYKYGNWFCSFANDEDRAIFIIKDGVRHRFGWEAWGRMYRRDMIDKYKIRFADNAVIYAEDLYFYVCYLMVSDSFKCLDTVLYNYRMRDGSIMANVRDTNNYPRYARLCMAVFDFIKRNLKGNSVYLWYFPILNFNIMEIEIRNHPILDYSSSLVDSCSMEEKKFLKRWLRRVRYHRSARRIYDAYTCCAINIHATCLLGKNRIHYAFDTTMLRMILILCKLKNSVCK